MNKRIVFFFILLAALCGSGPTAAALGPDEIISETAVLMDAATGQVLFDKEMHRQMYPASTTKIMTAILTVENTYPAETVTTSKTALELNEPASSTIALTEGEEMTVDSALYALMLPSANDAANVLAEHIGGDQEAFAAMMTEKAALIGAADTHFTNAHGLHDEEHYTTAYDLALITRYAVGDIRFMAYFGKDTFTIPATNQRGSARQLTNHQSMLLESSRFYYPDVVGGKVGYTGAARHTMSTVAKRDGRVLIAIVMGSPYRDDKFNDTKKLLDFGFDEFTSVTVGKDMVEPFEVPIHDGGAMVGAATFQSGPSANFLMHQSASARDIQVEIAPPDFFERGDRIAVEARYSVWSAEEAVPPLLGTVPLTVRTEIYDVVTASLRLGGSASRTSFSVKSALIALAAITVSSVLIGICAHIHSIRKRRRARMRRLQGRSSGRRAR